MDEREDGWTEPGGPVPAAATVRPRLGRRQRLRLLLAVLAPVGVIGLVLLPYALFAGHSLGEVVAAAVVYGGLLGLAGGFVYVDRVQARACPRCGRPFDREAVLCRRCGYDVVARPRFICEERHAVYLDPGLCACGRRLRPLPVARGVRREVVVTLRIGAGLLVFLLAMGVILRLMEG